ncbi:MAG TPA: tRNA (adenosine(37)-N6)-threonylcarbamoyltransferase complex ATPase subunit type 1 TsaE, partial [Desulfobulbus sp.]|nr:tRNA (adenosine(37)-N6)-threonylcarbamoyltransferase complex ATPase subunit type 1 TsaE [Desulfobulbus sp.]
MDDSLSSHYTLTIDGLATMAPFGRQLGKLLIPGDVLLLYGGLGAGKTTLTQAIGQGLDVPSNYYISSPSFSLMHEYPGRCPLYHIDCYRLTGEDDIEGAGLVEYLEPLTGVCVVEWPERLGTLTPAQALKITF